MSENSCYGCALTSCQQGCIEAKAALTAAEEQIKELEESLDAECCHRDAYRQERDMAKRKTAEEILKILVACPSMGKITEECPITCIECRYEVIKSRYGIN